MSEDKYSFPIGKKFEPLSEDDDRHDAPYTDTCQCGHGDFEHDDKYVGFLKLNRIDGDCMYCKCPEFVSVGFMGHHKRKAFQKNLALQNNDKEMQE